MNITRPNPAIAPETLSLNAEKSAAMKITATRETFWTQMIKFPAPTKQFFYQRWCRSHGVVVGCVSCSS